eukprot:168269-Pyramimonas_sp.AAC.1
MAQLLSGSRCERCWAGRLFRTRSPPSCWGAMAAMVRCTCGGQRACVSMMLSNRTYCSGAS